MLSLCQILAPQKRTQASFEEESAEALRQMLHRSPRGFGYDTRAFGLLRSMAAQASFEEGLTPRGGSRARPSGGQRLGVFSECDGSGPQAVDHLP
jgi:hypothetical protein